MLMDYHLVFIVLSIFIFVTSILILFILENKERIYGALILVGLNLVLCQINYLGFFGIDLLGFTSAGVAETTIYSDMYPYFSFFFMLFWFNVVLIYYIVYRHIHGMWEIEKTSEKKQKYVIFEDS